MSEKPKKKKHPPTPKYPGTVDERLRHVFKYDDADLKENRAGQLSEKQRGQIHYTHYDNSRWIWTALIFLVGFLLVMGFITSAAEGVPIPDMLAGMGIATSLIAIGFAAIIFWNRWRMRRVIHRNEVEMTQGQTWLWAEGSKPTGYYLQVGDKRFLLSRTEYMPLRVTEGLTESELKVYYTPITDQIMSVDVLFTKKAKKSKRDEAS